MRSLLALALLGWATAASAEPPPLPAPLEGAVVDGEFQPGDLGWLRGRFADATETDKARLAEVKGWLEGCRAAATAEAKTQVEALGERADALPVAAYGDAACAAAGEFVEVPLPETMSFERFTVALTEARPIFAAYKAGLDAGVDQLSGAFQYNRPLLRMRATDQALIGLRWSPEFAVSGLSDEITAVTRLLAAVDMEYSVRKNTSELKSRVAKAGWPLIEGEDAALSSAAWLLTQHSDHDPAWQVRALRLMQPHVEAGGVNKSDFGYLQDRVQLALTGHQTFGTQMRLIGDCYAPAPIQQPGGVDERRRLIGLKPLEQYVADFVSHQSAIACIP